MYLRLPTSLIQNGIILFVLHNKSTILIWSEELLSHWSFGLSNRHSLRCTWMPFAPRPRARSLPAVFLSYNVSMFMLGATHKLRQLNFQNSWPPSPPCQHCGPFYCIKITQPPLLLRIWVTSPPSLPLSADVICDWALPHTTYRAYLSSTELSHRGSYNAFGSSDFQFQVYPENNSSQSTGKSVPSYKRLSGKCFKGCMHEKKFNLARIL